MKFESFSPQFFVFLGFGLGIFVFWGFLVNYMFLCLGMVCHINLESWLEHVSVRLS